SGVGESVSSPRSSISCSPPPEGQDELFLEDPEQPPSPPQLAPDPCPPPRCGIPRPTRHHHQQATGSHAASAQCVTPTLQQCMAPNDRSGVRVGRKATAADHVDQVMGGVGIVMGPQPDHTPHKDRPPDIIVPPTTPQASTQGIRHTRRLTPEDRRARRVHPAVALSRKRSGTDDAVSLPLTPPERRTKLPRGSPPPPTNGVKRLSEHLNGVVTETTAVLLDRLNAMSPSTRGRAQEVVAPTNGVSKDLQQLNGVTHLSPGKNGINCLNGITTRVNGQRVNGVTRLNGVSPPQRPERVNGVVRRLSVGDFNGHKPQQDLGYHTNNNQHHPPPEDVFHPKPLLSATPVAASLPHQPTTPLEAPTPPLTATPPTSTLPLIPTNLREKDSLTDVDAVTIGITPPPPPVIGREFSGAKPVLIQQLQQQRQQPPQPQQQLQQQQQQQQLQHPKQSNALSGWLSRQSSSCGSTNGISLSSTSGFSSGCTSSAPSSRPPTPVQKVRFPAPKKKETADICRWNNCNATMDPAVSLLEHIQAVHVEGQLSAENFRCLWVGCKVYDKASCSVSWLERHVLTHGGQKPFKCIVDGCGHRFASQTALGRHVNHHFNNSSTTPSPRPQPTPSPTKLIRKNGRKCRYRKKPWSADTRATKPPAPRMFDFFDASVMERIRWGLICVSEAQSLAPTNLDGTFLLNAQVQGRRTNLDGESEVMVKWLPTGVIPDEWVPVDKFEDKRSISLEKLSPEAKQIVSSKLYPVDPTTSHKHKRKRTTTSRDYLHLEECKPLNI
ncbi:unnamed protein product, partial [Meganyctiphanes norvegica]